MSKETVSNLLTYILFLVLVIGFSFMLRENTRLTVINHHLNAELKRPPVNHISTVSEMSEEEYADFEADYRELEVGE